MHNKNIQLIKQSIKFIFTFRIETIHPHVHLSAVMIPYSLPSNWQSPIRGRIQMNSWSSNENITVKVFEYS